MFFIKLKTRLIYILQNINANNLKLQFYEDLRKIIYKNYYIKLDLSYEKTLLKKKKKKSCLNQFFIQILTTIMIFKSILNNI